VRAFTLPPAIAPKPSRAVPRPTKRQRDFVARTRRGVEQERAHHERRSEGVRLGKRRRTRSELRQTAYHEAGHAVIGRVLTLPCGPATIKPSYEEMRAGYSITFDPYACEAEWQKRGKYRVRDAVWHARAIAYMAGAESERELLGEEATGDAKDKVEIARMLSEIISEDQWKRVEPRLRAMTRMLVRRHKAKIVRVAKALLSKRTLSRRQLDNMVGRSVADVKPNSPVIAMNESERKALRAALDKLAERSARGT